MTDKRQADISMHHIPIDGSLGAAVLIGILLFSVLGELPQLRWRFLGSAALGLLFAVALILWRRRSMAANSLPPGAHTMFPTAPVTSGETHRDPPLTPPGAHPLVVRVA